MVNQVNLLFIIHSFCVFLKLDCSLASETIDETKTNDNDKKLPIGDEGLHIVNNSSDLSSSSSCDLDDHGRNISLLERFQTHFQDRDRIYRLQEEQYRREEQIRKGIRSRGRTSCPLPRINCFRSRYRTIDGTCNNLINPRLGAAGECTPRMLPAEYADRISTPKVSVTGRSLPNPRTISLVLHSEPSLPSESITQMFMIYGQFLDHDMTFTPPAQSDNGEEIECCTNSQTTGKGGSGSGSGSGSGGGGRGRGSQRGFSSRRGSNSKWCYPISLSSNDPFYARMGQKCMEFVRSTACLSCTWGARYQLNEISSFIDASSVYGSLPNETQGLRNFDGSGTLKVTSDFRGRALLPRSLTPNDDGCSVPTRRLFCFNAGDGRVNQQASLASLHTIWHRHHNSLARRLKQLNPRWDGEKVFQEARRIVAAQVQVITYKEWLPLVLGLTMMAHYKLDILPTGFTEYDPTRDPSILSEFNTAAFRFGHSLIRGSFARVHSDGFRIPYRLKDAFFRPFTLRDGTLDAVIRGLLSTPISAWGPGVDEDVRNHLYQTSTEKFGGDLVAINIQRGRDHAIPGYTALVKHCYSKDIVDWSQLDEYMRSNQRAKYQSLYGHIYDIDLFSAGLSENPLPGALVGPTFACIIGNQFRNLRFGDRFWFEHANQDGSFTEAQINSLRVTSLAKIICANGDDFTIIHPRVFLPVSQTNPLTTCSDLPDIDLTLWTETPTNSFPRVFG